MRTFALVVLLCACGRAPAVVPAPQPVGPEAPAPAESLASTSTAFWSSRAGAPPVAFEEEVPPVEVDAGAVEEPQPAEPEPDAGSSPVSSLSRHTALGLPSSSIVGQPDGWLLVKPQYVAAYDTVHKVPRWVAWELTSAWLGTAPRGSSFRRDPQLPASAAQASDSDYTNSGYDRGHMCPSADRTATPADNAATFVLTNAVPQTHQNNAGPWEALEEESRTLAGLGNRLLIAAGPVYGASHVTIGSGVEVPVATWKVVVVLGEPAVTSATRVIAVIVPNTTSASGGWRGYRTTVDDVELQTGLDLMSEVDPAVQAVIEARVDAL